MTLPTDAMNALGPHELIGPAFDTVDALQSYSPPQQVQGLGLLFLEICTYYGVDPRDVLGRADKRRNDAYYAPGRTLDGIRDYIKYELH